MARSKSTKDIEGLQARIKVLEEEIEDLKSENRELLERALRARADYENLMKRTEQMKEEAQKYGNAQFMLALVRVYEDLERAIAGGRRLRSKLGRELLRGLEMIHDNLGAVLESQGVTAIDDVGTVFDPNLHEAIMTVKDQNKADGTIVQCIQRGYRTVSYTHLTLPTN